MCDSGARLRLQLEPVEAEALEAAEKGDEDVDGHLWHAHTVTSDLSGALCTECTEISALCVALKVTMSIGPPRG